MDKEHSDMLTLADMFDIELTDREDAVQVYKDMFLASADMPGDVGSIGVVEEGPRKGQRVGPTIAISHVIERWRLKHFNDGRSVWDA